MLRPSAAALLLAALVPSSVLAQGASSSGSAANSPEVIALLHAGEESPELRSLRLAEEEMFGRRGARVAEAAILQITPSLALTSDAPTTPGAPTSGGNDLRWLEGITLPDLPVRWEPRVIRFLEFFQRDRRGRRLMRGWLRRSNRYGQMISETLARHDLPHDLRCVAMAESGFDPTVHSSAGAAGMWQFVRRTAGQYDLEQDRWVDQRLDPILSTDAAARYLESLHRRLGSWELSLAAYNMGYGALLRAIRKYNTNDYWTLSRIEAGLPFETTIYVSKILACSIVMRNPERFGFGDLTRDPPLEVTTLEVPGGARLSQLARAAGIETEELVSLNPALRRNRTPPSVDTYRLHLPSASVERFTQRWSRMRPAAPLHRAYVVRFGEDLSAVARRYRTSRRELRRLNEMDDEERVSAGMTLLVPAVRPRSAAAPEEPPVVALPAQVFTYASRSRVFYRVASRDTIDEVARFFEVSPDELRLWNNLDMDARLHRGLFLQLFVPPRVDLDSAVVLTPDEVRVLVVGSVEFFEFHEAQRGRVRFHYVAESGDTLARLAQRFDLSRGSIARINRFSRRSDLTQGQDVIIYALPESVPARYRVAAGLEEPEEPAEPPSVEAIAEPAPEVEDPEAAVDGAESSG